MKNRLAVIGGWAAASVAAISFSRDTSASTNDSCTNSGGPCLTANNGATGGGQGTVGVTATTSTGIGVSGIATGSGIGVEGYAYGDLEAVGGYAWGNGPGVYGEAIGAGSSAAWFTGGGTGGYGQAAVLAGLITAIPTQACAIWADGHSLNRSNQTGMAGILASTGGNPGGVPAIQGTNDCTTNCGGSPYGVEGISISGNGVVGTNTGANSSGVYGTSGCAMIDTTCGGVAGVNTGGGNGVYGQTTIGYGVYGTSSGFASAGVVGSSTCTNGPCAGVTGRVGGSNSGTDWIPVAIEGDDNVTGTGPHYAGYFTGSVFSSGGYSSSDIRLKKNVNPVTGALGQLLQLKGVTFEWIDPAKHQGQAGTQRGFIAQDVEKIFPEWLSVDRDGYKAVSVNQIEALEVESIRQLNAENEALQAKSNEQQVQIDKQQAQIDKLERRLDTLTNGRDPISGGPGFGTGALSLMGLGLCGFAGGSRLLRRKGEESGKQG